MPERFGKHTYVSNSLMEQLIELVDSLISASVPDVLSIAAGRFGLDLERASFLSALKK